MIDLYWLMELFDREGITYTKDKIDDVKTNLIVTRPNCLTHPFTFVCVDDTLVCVQCGDSKKPIDKRCEVKYHAGLLKIYIPETWELGVPIP